MTAGPQRVTARFWLLEAPDSLAVQSHQERDGTGLGFYDEHGVPHVDKQPLPAYEDPEFAQEAREVRSRTFIAHIRFASTGAVSLENTHPFEQAGRLFAHNGVIGDLDALDRELGDARRLVRGQTDSERYFALVTKEAEKDGDAGAALIRAATWIAEYVPIYALNVVMVSADELWALRYPETHQLFVLERTRPEGPQRHEGPSGGIKVHSTDLADAPAVVVASEPMDSDPGWYAIPSGTLLHVGPDLAVTHTTFDVQPLHILRHDELDERAAASQRAR